MSSKTETDIARIEQAWADLVHALTCHSLLEAAQRDYIPRITEDLHTIAEWLQERRESGDFSAHPHSIALHVDEVTR